MMPKGFIYEPFFTKFNTLTHEKTRNWPAWRFCLSLSKGLAASTAIRPCRHDGRNNEIGDRWPSLPSSSRLFYRVCPLSASAVKAGRPLWALASLLKAGNPIILSIRSYPIGCGPARIA